MGTGFEKVKKEYYVSGATKRVLTVVDDVQEGPTVEYYESGAVRKKMEYVAGKIEGISQEFYESGELWVESICRKGQFHGLVRSFYRNGIVQSELPYVNGRLTGVARVYYSSGILKKEGKFKDGRQVGQAKIFLETGGLKRKGNFFDEDDSRDEVVYEKGSKSDKLSAGKLFLQFLALAAVMAIVGYIFDPNSPFFKSSNQQDITSQLKETIGNKPKRDPMLPPLNPQNGITKTFYPNGKLYAEWSFVDGKQDGVTKIYYQNGKIQSQLSYKNGKLDGESSVYGENGRRISKNMYKNGIPSYEKKTDETDMTQTDGKIFIPQNNKGNENVFDN